MEGSIQNLSYLFDSNRRKSSSKLTTTRNFNTSATAAEADVEGAKDANG